MEDNILNDINYYVHDYNIKDKFSKNYLNFINEFKKYDKNDNNNPYFVEKDLKNLLSYDKLLIKYEIVD